MPTDLEVIAQLEQEIGIKLEQITETVYQNRNVVAEAEKKNFYVIDDHGVVSVLNISGNQLNRFPKSVFLLKKLSHLDVSNNKIKKLLVGIAKLKKLIILDLSNNELLELPTHITQLHLLSSLYLSDNHFSILPEPIKDLPSLTRLTLRRCGIETLPPEIGQLKNLIKLDLDDNQLQELPPEICLLPSSLKLQIKGNNKLTKPPLAVAEQGIEAISHYFDSLPQNAPKTTNTHLSSLDVVTNPFNFAENHKPALGVEALAQFIAEQISNNHKTDEQYSIGIFGKWGRGKSFLIKQVIKQLKSNEQTLFHVVEFQAWRYQDTPANWAYLYEKFAEEYYANPSTIPSRTQDLLTLLNRSRTWLGKSANFIQYLFLGLFAVVLYFVVYANNLLDVIKILAGALLLLIAYGLSQASNKCIDNKLIEIAKTFEIKRQDCEILGYLGLLLSFTLKNRALQFFKTFFAKYSFQNLLGSVLNHCSQITEETKESKEL